MSRESEWRIVRPTEIEEKIWNTLKPRKSGGLVRNKAFVFKECTEWDDWYREPDPLVPDDWESKMLAGFRGEWFAHVVEGAKRVLDVGCGFGFPSFYLSRYGHDVTGIDPSPSEIETAKLIAGKSGDPPNLHFQVVDEKELPFGDDSFDAATFCTSLECAGEPETLFSEVMRVLQPGSPVAIIEEDRSVEPDRHPVWEKLRWAFFDEALWLWYEVRIFRPYLDRRYMLRVGGSSGTASRLLPRAPEVLSRRSGLPVLDFEEGRVSLEETLADVVDGGWSEAQGYDGRLLKKLLEKTGFTDIHFWLEPNGAEMARSLERDGLLADMPSDPRGVLRAVVRCTPTSELPVGCAVRCRSQK